MRVKEGQLELFIMYHRRLFCRIIAAKKETESLTVHQVATVHFTLDMFEQHPSSCKERGYTLVR